MNQLRRGRAWAPVLKAAVLFVLPLPLGLAFILALITGEFVRFAAANLNGDSGFCVDLAR